jgi:hypothetical protein
MSELDSTFELCKEVYEAFPEWTDTRDIVWNGSVLEHEDRLVDYAKRENYKPFFPLYTSDYLLEKLPTAIKIQDPDIMEEPHVEVHHSGVVKPQYRWCAKAFNGDWFEVSSDTPLKALLKLTIALSEAGELK